MSRHGVAAARLLYGVLLISATITAGSGCAEEQPARPPVCGDGLVEGEEGCDAGASNSDTAECTLHCLPGVCGDGLLLENAELCDDGPLNSDHTPNACRTSCRPAHCGDNVIDDTEECDAGEDNSDTTADACRSDCTSARCGDGAVDSGEECDAGAANSDTTPDACRTSCKSPVCGDGVLDTDEECDAGTTNSDTTPNACRTHCTAAACGDGVLDNGEECDNGATNSDTLPNACSTSCALPYCLPTEVSDSDHQEPGSITGQTHTSVPVSCDSGFAGGGDWLCGEDGAFDGAPCAALPCDPTEVADSLAYSKSGSLTGATGDTLEVQCATGYQGGGLWSCGANGEKHGTFTGPKCQPAPCRSTRAPHSRDFIGEGSIKGATGETVPVVCTEGYSGGGDFVCRPDGAFLGAPCAANRCEPTRVNHSTAYSEAGSLTGVTGDTAPVSCTRGHFGGGLWECGPGGIFTGPQCTPSACDSTETDHTLAHSTSDSIIGVTGDQVIVTCAEGFSGGGAWTCSPTGNFSGPGCSLNGCEATSTPHSNKATMDSINGATGDAVLVTCDHGYQGGGIWTCGPDKTFSGPECSLSACEATETPDSDHAVEDSINGAAAEEVQVVCDPGFKGGGTWRCLVDETFIGAPCEPTPCEASAPPEHGESGECEGPLQSGASCEVICDTGYTLSKPTSCYAGTLSPGACVPNPCGPTRVPGSRLYGEDGSLRGATGDTAEVDCAEGSFGGGTWTCNPHGEFSGPSCDRWTECEPGERVVNHPDAKGDRTCVPCEASMFSTEANAEACAPTLHCLPGERVVINPTPSSNRTCAPCGEQEFSEDQDAAECLAVSSCPPGEYVTGSPSSSQNRRCAPCGEETTFAMDLEHHNGWFTQPPVTSPTGLANDLAPEGWTRTGGTGQGLQREDAVNGQGVFWNNPAQDHHVDTLSKDNLYTLAPGDVGNQIKASWLAGSAAAFGNTGWTGTDAQLLGSLTLDGDLDLITSGPIDAGALLLGGEGSRIEVSYTVRSEDVGKRLGVYFSFSAAEGSTSRVQLLLAEVTVMTPSGSYSTVSNAEKCASWKVCSEGYSEMTAGSPTRDRRCAPDPCDTREAPVHGAVGDCPDLLLSGAICQPTCDPGYQVSGASSCYAGNLVAAACLANECEATLVASSDHKSPGALTGLTGAQVPVLCDPGFAGGGLWKCEPSGAFSGLPCEACLTSFADKGEAACTPWTQCGPGEELVGESSLTDGECRPCALGSYAEAGSTSCLPFTPCRAGEELVGESESTDGTCDACADGTYSQAGATACLPWTQCAPGSGLTGATPIAPGSCEACEDSRYSGTNDTTACLPWPVCPKGEGLFGHSDQSEGSCAPCAEGTYSSTAGSTPCHPLRTCPVGQGLTGHSSLAPGHCEACNRENFSATEGIAPCAPWTRCGPGEELQGETGTRDGTCQPCANGWYAPAGANLCTPWTQCLAGEELKGETPQSDGQCHPCVAGTYSKAGANQCTPWPQCGAGSGLTGASDSTPGSCEVCDDATYSTTEDSTACRGWPTCPGGQGLVGHSSGSEGSCAPCTEGTYSATATPTACQPFRVCPVGQGLTGNSPTASGYCEACNRENFSDTEGTGPCTPWTRCGTGEELKGETDTSDGVCQPCPERWYAPAGANLCTPWIQCGPGEELKGESTTTDGQCEACAAGTYSPAGDNECTPWFQCAPGKGLTGASDSTPGSCEVCDNATYSDTLDATGCTPWTLCPRGEGLIGHSSQSTGSCAPCTEGTYSDATAPASCAPFKSCPVGQGLIGNSATAPGYCQACNNRNYSDTEGSASCAPWVQCGPGEELKGASHTNEGECRPCATGAYAAAGATECTPWTQCLPGEELKGESTQSDGQCHSCAVGTYSTAGATECTPWTQCGAGRGLTGASGTAPGTCKACNNATYSDTLDATGCTPWPPCQTGEGLTGHSSESPGSCTPCAEDTYSDTNTNTACQPFRSCPVGQGLTGNSATAPGYCQACNSRNYSDTEGVNPCAPWTQCGPGEELKGASHTSAGECRPCSTGAYAPAGATECTPWTQCLPGEELKGESDTSDGQCQRCAAGTYSHAGATECTPWTWCPKGKGLTGASSVSDGTCETCNDSTYSSTFDATECTPWTTCPKSEGLTDHSSQSPGTCAPCTEGTYSDANAPASCQSFSACPVGQGLTGNSATAPGYCQACNSQNYSDIEGVFPCAPWAECDPGEELKGESATSEGQCRACAAGTYSSAGATECTPVTPCPPGAGVKTSPTRYADTVCESCTPGVTYSGQADMKECTPVSTCGPGSGVLTPPTATSNSECSSCAPGYFNATTSAAGPCVPCDDGEVQPESGHTSCTRCPAGTKDNGAEVCVSCPPYFTSTPGATSCHGDGTDEDGDGILSAEDTCPLSPQHPTCASAARLTIDFPDDAPQTGSGGLVGEAHVNNGAGETGYSWHKLTIPSVADSTAVRRPNDFYIDLESGDAHFEMAVFVGPDCVTATGKTTDHGQNAIPYDEARCETTPNAVWSPEVTESWSFGDTGTNESSATFKSSDSSWPEVYFIRLKRITAGTTCQEYTLEVDVY